MANKELNSPDMVGELLGKRQRRAHQTRNALSQRVVEPLDVISFPRQLTDGSMLHRGNHLLIHYILIGVKRGMVTVRFRNLGPQLLSTRVAAIAHVKGNDWRVLASMAIHTHCLFAFFWTKLAINLRLTGNAECCFLGLWQQAVPPGDAMDQYRSLT